MVSPSVTLGNYNLQSNLRTTFKIDQPSSRLLFLIYLIHHSPNTPSLLSHGPGDMPPNSSSALLEYIPNSSVENTNQYMQTKDSSPMQVYSTIPVHECFALGKLLFSDYPWHSDWLSYFVFAVSLACKAFLPILCLLRS